MDNGFEFPLIQIKCIELVLYTLNLHVINRRCYTSTVLMEER